MRYLKILAAFVVLAACAGAWAQGGGCDTRDQIPDQTRTAIENAAQQIFDHASSGDVNSLKANAIPSLQSSFNGVAGAVNDNKAALTGAKPQLRATFLIDTGPNPSPDGRYFCGVFGSNGRGPGGADFVLPNLPVGKWAVVVQDFIGNKGPYSLTTIMQDLSGWKLAGFNVHPEAAMGHDGIWYLQHARDYKAKNQDHNAWFYMLTSWDLLAPIPAMHTNLLDKIGGELEQLHPKDVPQNGPLNFSANGKTYNITDMSVYRTDNSFDLSIKYSVPSTADFAATAADAKNLANAYVTQYPELKDAFNNVWAHAIDPNGGDVPGIVVLKPAAK